jgi:hypothetical protein
VREKREAINSAADIYMSNTGSGTPVLIPTPTIPGGDSLKN